MDSQILLIDLPDLRHICQNLNQFGHGRGTIYGGNELNKQRIFICSHLDVFLSDFCKLRLSLLWNWLWPNYLNTFSHMYLRFQFCPSLGCAQYTIIPARYCYQLKTNLDVDRACLLERKKAFVYKQVEIC